MEQINIKLLKTARNYASALFETALPQNISDSVMNDINLIADTVKENNELQKFLNNPVIKTDDKKSALKEIFENKINLITLNFLFLLADNSRFDAVQEIRKEYKELTDKSRNLVLVKAISAVSVKDYLKQKLKAKLESILYKNVEIQYEINPEIIGGLILEVNGKTIDNSVYTQLKNIKKQLI